MQQVINRKAFCTLAGIGIPRSSYYQTTLRLSRDMVCPLQDINSSLVAILLKDTMEVTKLTSTIEVRCIQSLQLPPVKLGCK